MAVGEFRLVLAAIRATIGAVSHHCAIRRTLLLVWIVELGGDGEFVLGGLDSRDVEHRGVRGRGGHGIPSRRQIRRSTIWRMLVFVASVHLLLVLLGHGLAHI